MQPINSSSSWAKASSAPSTSSQTSSQTSSKNSDDINVCAVCLEEFEKKITVPRCGHAFHPKCFEDWKIASAALAVQYRVVGHVLACPVCRSELDSTDYSSDYSSEVAAVGLEPAAEAPLDTPNPVTLHEAILNRNFPLAQRLVNDHGAILTAETLKMALENAAETRNAHQVRKLLELSSTGYASQEIARMVLGNVLQKAMPQALNMSDHSYLQLMNFVKVFLDNGIQAPESVNKAMAISVQRSELNQAKEFKCYFGGQLDLSTLASALRQSINEADISKAKMLLILVMPDDAVRTTASKILAERLANTLPQAEGMSGMNFCRIMAVTRLFFRFGIVNPELANMALKICVLNTELEDAQEFKTKHRAQLELTTFRTVLLKMTETLDLKKTYSLLGLILPDAAAGNIARKILKEFLHNKLPQVEGMSGDNFGKIMSFTQIFFQYDLVGRPLANMALGMCVLNDEFEWALEFKTKYGANLEATTFRTVLQKMAQTWDERRNAKRLLNLVVLDAAARSIARKILTEALQNALPLAEKGMTMRKFAQIMTFTRLLFSHGIGSANLIDMAMRFCILNGEVKQAQEIKAEYRAFVDENDQTAGDGFTSSENRSHKRDVNHQRFAQAIGYTLTGNPIKDYRNMAKIVHPDMPTGSNTLMKELNRLYNR